MVTLQRKIRKIMLIVLGIIIIAYLFVQSERLRIAERKPQVHQPEIFKTNEETISKTDNDECKNTNFSKGKFQTDGWQKVDKQGTVYVYSAYVSWAGDSDVLIVGTEKSADTMVNREISIRQRTEEAIFYCVYWHLGHFTNSMVEAGKVVCTTVEMEK